MVRLSPALGPERLRRPVDTEGAIYHALAAGYRAREQVRSGWAGDQGYQGAAEGGKLEKEKEESRVL